MMRWHTCALKALLKVESRTYIYPSKIAHETAQQADYMKQRGIDGEYCRKMIVDYLTKFKTGTREDFERVILDKLPDVLSDTQKKNKIRNVLQGLKKLGIIELADQKNWRLNGVN